MSKRRQNLRAELESWVPPSSAEALFRTRMIALCDSDAPMSRNQYEPGHFTASAFVLGPDQKTLLLIYHGKLHRWLQPGGHVEVEDADLAHAARREVQEECNLEADDLELLQEHPFDIDIHPIPARQDEPAHEHFDVRFLFRCSSMRARAGDEVLDLRYVPLDEIDKLESDASVMRAVHRLQQALEN
jgi:8-oxo-dGTP pyrophosphatase MutT (NUDIX family)